MARKKRGTMFGVTLGTINAMARSSARQQREREAQARRHARDQKKAVREAERAAKLKSKEDKQRYFEGRVEEVEDLNAELEERIEALQNILQQTLAIDDTISFKSLRVSEEYEAQPVPQELVMPKPAPDKQAFVAAVKQPGFLQNALGLKGKYQRELQAAEAQYELARSAWEESEAERKRRLAQFAAEEEEERREFVAAAQQRNREVDELETAYRSGEIQAVISYNSMVLERSDYPDGFPHNFRLAYTPESKELVIDYELPSVSVIPEIAEHKYSKTKDEIDEKPRKPAEIKELYQDIVASVAIRTIHEVFEADQGEHVAIVVFSGFVQAVDPATGKDIRPYIVSVRATGENFLDINLARVDKRACLRNLGAQVSPQPQALQPIKPVVEFNMVDKRYIEQADVLSDLESRPNLMDLSPSEFEALVSNLFGKMGLETRLTRASRDGGVDAVAFDTRPILGGKVVIQAKRYKNTVGVSAVRDLYGTMLNEGASKGIIVSTASYGPDAFEFAKDKPLELIDGGGLLYLLEQVGVKARIVMPEDG